MKQRDVAARQKCGAIAAQHDDAHGLIVARFLAYCAQTHDHVRIERIHDLRAVERDRRHAVG